MFHWVSYDIMNKDKYFSECLFLLKIAAVEKYVRFVSYKSNRRAVSVFGSLVTGLTEGMCIRFVIYRSNLRAVSMFDSLVTGLTEGL
jgi:hypothetical protein